MTAHLSFIEATGYQRSEFEEAQLTKAVEDREARAEELRERRRRQSEQAGDGETKEEDGKPDEPSSCETPGSVTEATVGGDAEDHEDDVDFITET